MITLFQDLSRELLDIPPAQRAATLFERSARLPMRFIRLQPEVPYLERYFLAEEAGCFAYLHRFISGDGDRHVHSHPWAEARSLILAGGYREVRRTFDSPPEMRGYRAGQDNLIQGDDLHQILEVDPETWTLFVHTDWIQPWGFVDDAGVMRIHPSDTGLLRHWWTQPESLRRHEQRTPFQTFQETLKT